MNDNLTHKYSITLKILHFHKFLFNSLTYNHPLFSNIMEIIFIVLGNLPTVSNPSEM